MRRIILSGLFGLIVAGAAGFAAAALGAPPDWTIVIAVVAGLVAGMIVAEPPQ